MNVSLDPESTNPARSDIGAGTDGNPMGLELSSLTSVIRRGMFICLFGFGVFMLWASVVPLDEGVIALGRVSVDGKRKTIQHYEGGIVKAIHVKEGSQVQPNDILIELDQTQTGAQQDLLQVRHDTWRAMLDRLTAEQKELDEIEFAQDLIDRDNNSEVAGILQAQLDIFVTRKNELQGNIDILQQKVEQLNKQKSGFEAEHKAQLELKTLIEDELSRLERLYEEGVVDLPQVQEQRRAHTQTTGAIAKLKASISGIDVAIGEARLEILQLDRKFKQEVAEQALSTQENLLEVKEQLAAAKDVVRRSYIRAPQAGTVLGLRYVTEGGVIAPGDPVMDLVPQDETLVMEVQINPTDIDNVWVGQEARVIFSALPRNTTPELLGTVEDVSADAVFDEAAQSAFFNASVSIGRLELERLGDEQVLPGMPVEIMLISGSHTALEYLLDPLSTVLRRALTEE